MELTANNALQPTRLGSKRVWYRSLGELGLKFVLLVGLSVLVISQW